jgi:hypothetical protein
VEKGVTCGPSGQYGPLASRVGAKIQQTDSA